MWARKKCIILTHEIYTRHCPKIKYHIVPKMRFRDTSEAVSTVEACLFPGRLCEWDSCSFCRNISVLEEWWGEELSTALRGSLFAPSPKAMCGALYGHSCELGFGKGSLGHWVWTNLALPQRFLVKVLTLSLCGDSACCRCPTVPVQSPLSYSGIDWSTVSGVCI